MLGFLKLWWKLHNIMKKENKFGAGSVHVLTKSAVHPSFFPTRIADPLAADHLNGAATYSDLRI